MLSDFKRKILTFDLIYFVICCILLSLDIFHGIVLRTFLFLYIIPTILLTGFTFLYENKTKKFLNEFIKDFSTFEAKKGIINILFYLLLLLTIPDIYSKHGYKGYIREDVLVTVLLIVFVRFLIFTIQFIKKNKIIPIILIDIFQCKELYLYIYLFPKNNQIYKITFTSHVPYNNRTNLPFILEEKKVDLKVGNSFNLFPFGRVLISCFSKEEKYKYRNFKDIRNLLNTALTKQTKLVQEFNKQHNQNTKSIK